MIIGCICLVCRVLPAKKTKAGWWNKNWEYRLSFTVQNPSTTVLTNVPVVMTGKEFMDKAGLTNEKISILSLRLIDSAGREKPVQVDEKDNAGLFLANGSGVMNKNDEIVFEVSLKSGEKQTLTFYFSKGLVPRESYPTDLKFEKTNFSYNEPYNALLSNSIIKVGIRGDGTEKNPNGTLPFNGWAKASITSLQFKNVDLININSSYDWFLGNNGLVRDLALNIPWKNPELLINGPVRMIVACRTANININFTKMMKDRNWMLGGKFKGDIIRYFILYAHSPLCEMDETYIIDRADAKFNCLYQFYWMMPTCPRDWDNDQMFIPLAGKSVVIHFKDNRKYNTDKPSEGWVAIVNSRMHRGLAVFFNKNLAANVSADFIPPGITRQEALSSQWDKLNAPAYLGVSYVYNNTFNLKPVQKNVFGYYVMTKETPNDVRAIYNLVWDKGLIKTIKFGFPEEK